MSKNKQVVTFGLSAKQYKAFSDWKNSLPPLTNEFFIFKFICVTNVKKVEIERCDGIKIHLKEDYLQ